MLMFKYMIYLKKMCLIIRVSRSVFLFVFLVRITNIVSVPYH